MSGITVTAELNSAETQARLVELLARLSDLTPFMNNVGDALVISTKERFRNQTDPEGSAWVPLSPAYARAKLKRRKGIDGGRILTMSGDLGGNIFAQPGPTEVRVGSSLDYAAIHQLGGTIRKAAGSRSMVGRRFAKPGSAGSREVGIGAHSIAIPARPYLGVSAEDEADIFSLATHYMTR